MSRLRGLRALRGMPLAALLAVLVAAVGARATRPSAAPSAGAAVSPTVGARSADTPASSSSLGGSLALPSPPSGALAPAAAPRAIHGGARHTHRSGARAPRSARVAWRVDVGGPVAAQVIASPDERTLYVSTLGGALVALARDTGERRWSVDLGDRVYSAPLVHDDGTIYVGSDAKRFVALSPTGATLWRLEVDGEADTAPVFAPWGDVLFGAGAAVYAVRRGGDVAWRFSTKKKVFTSPAVTPEGLVIVGAQDHAVRAIDRTGQLVWSVDLGADVDGAAVIGDDGSISVGTDAGEIVRLDARGAVRWRARVGGFVRGVLSLSRGGDVLAGTYGPVPRVVRVGDDGNVRGSFVVPGTGAREFGIHGGPLEDAEGTLLFGAQDDAVRAVAWDGSLRFVFPTGGDVDAPLTLLADGSLVVPSEDGSVTLLAP